ncbi:hypothetical protein CY652_21300 [Burkholderia sp. WAC0059]|uniref:AraC family transcriptional regulator n=1 Tax=Burkholderia sp. WAC0059 TaxID=2066022 RepID=UPI000C7EC426|nr:AraC family transcriptional regulator [Burkholderia sp. WAC0059]PLZ00405.1 hypothetical protein CY652_21300 [Burkholderia sp. WAC0059]
MSAKHIEPVAKTTVSEQNRSDIREASQDLLAWESNVSSELIPISLQVVASPQDESPQILSRFRRISVLRSAQMSVRGITARPRLGNGTQFDYLKILFVTKGRSRMSGANMEVLLDAGMWTVYNPAQPYQLDAVEPYECVALAMPAKIFTAAGQWSQSSAMHSLPIRGNISLALQSIMLYLDTGQEFDALEESAAASTIVTLIRSGLGRLANVPIGVSVSNETALRARIDAEIAAQSSDPDFTVERLAERLGVSRRTLYKAFESGTTTPHKAILGHRLEASGRALSDPTLWHRSVTDIALDAGFPDSAHFSRVFSHHFGVTPSAYRRHFFNS